MFPILGIVGFLCMIFSLSVIPPMLVSLLYDDGELAHFAVSFLLISATGLALCVRFARRLHSLNRSEYR